MVKIRFLKDWKRFKEGQIYETNDRNVDFFFKHLIAERFVEVIEKPVEESVEEPVEVAVVEPDAETADLPPEVNAAKALYSKPKKPKKDK